MTTTAEELPTYLQDDWGRDWGVLSKLTPFPAADGSEPKQVELDTENVRRSGLWTPGPMKHNES
jgi:arabinosyltransferase C